MEQIDVISRAELAAMIPRMTTERLAKSEKRLGLTICKITWSRKLVYYRRTEALQILTAMGFPIPRSMK